MYMLQEVTLAARPTRPGACFGGDGEGGEEDALHDGDGEGCVFCFISGVATAAAAVSTCAGAARCSGSAGVDFLHGRTVSGGGCGGGQCGLRAPLDEPDIDFQLPRPDTTTGYV
jgi:hypothetical protein